MNWYHAAEGKQTGPIDDQQFIELVRTGVINDDTLVWHDGLTDWAPYRNLKNSQAASAPLTEVTFPAVREAPGVVCSKCKKTFPPNQVTHQGGAFICASCQSAAGQSTGAAAVSGSLEYAGFWIRLAAKLLDSLILGVVLFVPLFAIFFFLGMAAASKSSQSFSFVDSGQLTPGALEALPLVAGLMIEGTVIFLNVLYCTFFLGKFGATPGKMLCGLKVVTADGAKITYARGFARSLSEILSGIPCSLGYIIAAFDRQKRALHDHICTTRVIHK